MPEIGEVARAVHYIRKHLVGRTLAKVTAFEDGNVFGKVGTSHTEIMKHLKGKKVVSSAQQGKYFWMEMSSPPHLLMHFGMAGWLRFKSEHTFYYRKKEGEDESWPPRWSRFVLETDGSGDDKIEAAFVDMRRFARVRLIDCPGDQIREHSPLKENGPDPVQDQDIVTVDWLKDLCKRKKVPVKAMLLDQANISGIGNWVGDEIMYDARMHPEQYANTLSDMQIEQLHKSLHYICGTAVELLSDTDKFPEEWLFKHRWGKGKKDAPKTLPNGEKIVFLTVGGRTSAVIPSMQKKTGPVAASMSDAESEEGNTKTKKKNKRVKEEAEVTDEEEEPPAKKAKKGKKVKAEDEAEQAVEQKPSRKTNPKKPKQEEPKAAPPAKAKTQSRKKSKAVNGDADGDEAGDQTQFNGDHENDTTKPTKKTSKRSSESKKKDIGKKGGTKAKVNGEVKEAEDTGRRRSGRLSKS